MTNDSNTRGMGEMDRGYRRQAQLDTLQDSGAPILLSMGRALVEWSGLDPTDSGALERFAEAIGWSSIPEAAATVGESVSR